MKEGDDWQQGIYLRLRHLTDQLEAADETTRKDVQKISEDVKGLGGVMATFINSFLPYLTHLERDLYTIEVERTWEIFRNIVIYATEIADPERLVLIGQIRGMYGQYHKRIRQAKLTEGQTIVIEFFNELRELVKKHNITGKEE